jgi:hypothetical protein
MTPIIHQDENSHLVQVYWHQISQNKQSIHHRAHEFAQDRLSVILSTICLLAKILKLAVTMTPKIKKDGISLLVLLYWHQIEQNELSIHHKAHEITQDRLSDVVSTRCLLTEIL